MYFESTNGISFMGRVHVLDNAIHSSGSDEYAGAGMYFWACTNMQLSGEEVLLKNNTLFGIGSGWALGAGLFLQYCKNFVIERMAVMNNVATSTFEDLILSSRTYFKNETMGKGMQCPSYTVIRGEFSKKSPRNR